MNRVAAGVIAVLVYTGLIATADGITKMMASEFAPAQLFAVSGLLVAAFCLGVNHVQGHPDGLSTRCVKAMMLRSVATVLACTSFFFAFRYLALAEVFVFIALMPLFAALLSGLILKERIRPVVWLALCLGVVGLLVMRPAVQMGGATGSALALAGVGFGTLSIIMARYISRYDSNVLPQVFYPNLTLGVVMLCVLPFVWRPMAVADWGWICTYAVVLFGARWLLVSFNNEGYQSRNEMEQMLACHGNVFVVTKDFKRYVGAQIGVYNPKGDRVGKVSHLRNEEYIYLVARPDLLARVPDALNRLGSLAQRIDDRAHGKGESGDTPREDRVSRLTRVLAGLGKATRSELRQATELSDYQTRMGLESLVRRGLVATEGDGRRRTYALAQAHNPPEAELGS